MDYTSLSCCALAFCLYLNTLNAGFVYDDRRAILGNNDVSGSTTWVKAFQNDYWGTPLTDSGSHGSYRPFCVLTFKVNYILGGHTPWGYHLINNLMHCLATGLVVKLARQLLPSVWGVFATGAFFAVHPIHTEAVAGIVGRADLAACIFYLLTYLMFIKHISWREKHDSRQWFALCFTVILSMCAILFKETAVTALVVCAIFDFIRGLCGYVDKNRYRTIIILTVAFITIIYIRLLMSGPKVHFSTADNPIAKTNSLWTRLLTFLYLPVFNFQLLAYPLILSFDWGMDAIPRITTFYDIRNILSISFYATLVSTIWRCVRILSKQADYPRTSQHRKSRSKRKLIFNSSTLESEGPHDHNSSSRISKNSNITSNLQNSSTTKTECVCQICNHELTIRHSSSCRAINNNNVPGTHTDCACFLDEHKLSTVRSISPNDTSKDTSIKSSISSLVGTDSRRRLNESVIHQKRGDIQNNERTPTNSEINTTTDNLNDVNNNNSNNDLLKNLPSKAKHCVVLIMSVALLTLPFLPATNLFFYVGFVVAERLLYMPSVGYCLLMGFGVSKMIDPLKNSKKRFAVLLCMSLVISILSIRTWKRNYDWRDEESLYRSAIAVNPPKALGNLGSVLSSQGKYQEAKEVLLEALKFRPNMADVHFNLGILHQNLQNFETAIVNFQRAIQFRPNLASAYLNMGSSLIALGRCQEAASVLKEGARVDGTGVRDRVAHENARMSSYLQLGDLYAEQGKLQRALAVYREAMYSISSSYQREVLYHRLGDIFGRLHQWNEAERYHRAVLDLQPNHVAAHLSYGITLAKNTSRASEAELWFKRALMLAPTQSSVYHHYAEFLLTHSRYEEACDYRVRAAELSPDDYSLVVSAATALRLLDRKIEAEKWYRKAVQLRPNDARAHTNLGAILHLLGRKNKAAASYKEALRLQPGDPTTLGNLAKLGVNDV